MYKFSEFADDKNNLKNRSNQKVGQVNPFKKTYEGIVNTNDNVDEEEAEKKQIQSNRKDKKQQTRDTVKGSKNMHKEQEGSNPDKDLDLAMEEQVQFIGKLIKISENLDPKQLNKILESYKNLQNKYWYCMVEKNEEFHFIKNNEEEGVDMKFFIENLINYYLKNQKVTENIKTMNIIGNSSFVIMKHIPPKFKDMIKNDLIKLFSKEV